jgi:hypothetical protein
MNKQSRFNPLGNCNKDHWWQELPALVKLGINGSIEQAKRGEFISLDEVKKEVSAMLKNEARIIRKI